MMRRERGLVFTPITAVAIVLLLLSASYLSLLGRESGYLVRAEYIKPIVNQAVLAASHQRLSRAVYLGVVDFINGASLPGGGRNGYRNGRIAVHEGGSNIEWITPQGLAAPYRTRDVGTLDGDWDAYRDVIESLRYYIDYEFARMAVDVHDKIKRSTNAEVWVVPRCYVQGEPPLSLDLRTWRFYLSRYIPSDPNDPSRMAIVPSSDDPFTLYVHVQVTLVVQAPRWELLYMDLGRTTVAVSLQGYAPGQQRPLLDPLPLWTYYVARNRWGSDAPLRFKPQLVIGYYQTAAGAFGTLGGRTVTQSDLIRFYRAYLAWNNGEGWGNSEDPEDAVRMAHVLSVAGKMVPWDENDLTPGVDPNNPPWVILPYFPVRYNDELGRPPNLVERAAGILYVTPGGGSVISVDGHKSACTAVRLCDCGMETILPMLPVRYVRLPWQRSGANGTVDWMAWMGALASRSWSLRGAMWRYVDVARDQDWEPLNLYSMYAFNADDGTVRRINELLDPIGLRLATDRNPRGFALPGAELARWFLFPHSKVSMVAHGWTVFRLWKPSE